MELNLKSGWLFCVLIGVLILPLCTDGMSFGFNPDTDTDSDETDDDSNPPIGFVGFGTGGMRFSWNTPGEGSDPGPEGTEAPPPGQPGVDFQDNFGCCPPLNKKTKRKNKKNCGSDPGNECEVDWNCGLVNKCCFDGCRKTCEKPTKTCKNSKKWKSNLKVKLGDNGPVIECKKCGCDEIAAKDYKKPGFLKALCKDNIKEVADKCCKLCELNHNMGYHEPC